MSRTLECLKTIPNEGLEVGCSDKKAVYYDYEEVLRKLGFGKVQWTVLVASGLFLIMATNEILGMGVIVIASKCDFDINATKKGILTAISYLGNVCATYLFGYLSDTVGRKSIILYSAMATNLLNLISIMIPNFWIFIFLRFLVGFTMCGSSSVTFAYLGELISDKHRALSFNYANTFGALSGLYVPLISWIILSMDWTLYISEAFVFHPWRLLLVLYFLPGFIGALIMLALPESPKLLLSHGRIDEALDVLNWVCQKNLKGLTLKDLNIQLRPFDESEMAKSQIVAKRETCYEVMGKMWRNTRPLFKRPHIWNFLICCVTMCCSYMIAMGLGVWFPEIQNRLSSNVDGPELGTCEIIQATFEAENFNRTDAFCDSTISDKTYIDYAVFGVLCIVGYIVLGGIINRIDRKLLLLSFLLICGIAGILIIAVENSWGVLISFSILLVLAELGFSLVNGIIVDLLPTHLRGQGVCFCLMAGRLSTVIALNLVATVIETECAATFFFFSVFSFASAFLAYFLPMMQKSKQIKKEDMTGNFSEI